MVMDETNFIIREGVCYSAVRFFFKSFIKAGALTALSKCMIPTTILYGRVRYDTPQREHIKHTSQE
jgi:hypothetical protein